MSNAVWHTGDALTILRTLPDDSVDMAMTSPPFLALRNYLPTNHPNKNKEIGSESTPGAFLDVLLDVTEELARVLAPHGSIVIELGDTYSGSGGAGGDYAEDGWRGGQPTFEGSARKNRNRSRESSRPERWHTATSDVPRPEQGGGRGWPLAKSLCCIPGMYEFALSYGLNPLTGRTTPPWRVRNWIAWCRSNPPVGALGDKVRPATSFLTVACKSASRYFDLDAIREPYSANSHPRVPQGSAEARERTAKTSPDGNRASLSDLNNDGAGAPPLDWWEIPTEPYKGSHYACVDEQTDALTPRGWKRHDQIKPGDLIAAYEPDVGTWRWQVVQEMHSYLYDGSLVSFEKRTVSQRLTPNHRVLYCTRKQPTPQVRRADEITGGCYLPMSSPMAVDIPCDGPGEKLAALAGWMVTEGGWSGNQAMIYQSQAANPQHCATIRALLEAVGADFTERSGHHGGLTFIVRGELAYWLMGFHKSLPMDAVFSWPIEDARTLFEAMVDGDGHRRPNDRLSFIQKSEATSDAFQALATRLGYRTMQSKLRGDGIRVVYCATDRWIDLRAGDGGTESAISSEHYQGVVWCPRVDSGLWFARRNGRPFITGNTFPSDLCVRPIKSMCPIKVCQTCGKPSERITEDNAELAEAKRLVGDKWKSGGLETGLKRPSGADRIDVPGHKITTGWTDCGHDNWRAGVVLDPFAGSGTVGAVATGHGRDAVLIDIDSRNYYLARERIGMFLTEVHGLA